MVRHLWVCFLLSSQDLALGLQPVIKGTLANALFVDLVGSNGSPFVKIFGRCRLRSLSTAAWRTLLWRT